MSREEELLRWLYDAQRFGIKLGLENTLRLFSAMGDPHRRIPCFHVAGTNGKGSVCAMLAACLREAGHRTALYTSPHLVRFSERIQIDGKEIPRESIAEGLEQIRGIVLESDHSPTFFEIATVLAFDWFAREGCDVAVIETGMGGRLDSTNVVDPLVSVITPVANDHAQWLGDTLEKIASEKAGIIKPKRPVVSAPQDPVVCDVLVRKAATENAPLLFVDEPWGGEVGLVGDHQRWNAALVAAALSAGGIPVSPGQLARGIAGVSWRGRFQRLGDHWVLDGAHNPHAAKTLVAAWRGQFGEARVPILFGCLDDKQPGEILATLTPIASEFHLVPVGNVRGLDPGSMRGYCTVPATVYSSLKEALSKLSEAAGPVLITGSLFLVGEALEQLST